MASGKKGNLSVLSCNLHGSAAGYLRTVDK